MDEITIKLSKWTQDVLFKHLHIRSFNEVMNLKYKSDGDIDKDRAKIYQRLIRGSIRIKDGRYRSKLEKEERIKKFKKLDLP